MALWSVHQTPSKQLAEKWAIKRLLNLNFRNLSEKFKLLNDNYFDATITENFCCKHQVYHEKCVREEKNGCDELILEGSSFQYVLLCCDWKYKLNRSSKWVKTVAFFREKGVQFDKNCATRFFDRISLTITGPTKKWMSPIDYFTVNFQEVFTLWKARADPLESHQAELDVKVMVKAIGSKNTTPVTATSSTEEVARDEIEIKFDPENFSIQTPDKTPISSADDSDDDVIFIGISHDAKKDKPKNLVIKEEPSETVSRKAPVTSTPKPVPPPMSYCRVAVERPSEESTGSSDSDYVLPTSGSYAGSSFASDLFGDVNKDRNANIYPRELLTHEQFFKYYIRNKFKRDWPNSLIQLADRDIERMWKIESNDPYRKSKIIAACSKHNSPFQKNI